MTSDRREPDGDPDDERRPHRDRDTGVNPWMPSADPVRVAMLQLGVDIYNPDSVEEFSRAIEWAAEGARRQKWWREMRSKIMVGSFVAAAAGAVGAAFSWLTSHIGTGTGHS